MFLFLVDDLNPIEAGLLPDGSPDLYFRGLYCLNSEVGAKALGIASFYLRAGCKIYPLPFDQPTWTTQVVWGPQTQASPAKRFALEHLMAVK